jgi:uncharacterized protein (DUF2062 family)
VPRKFFKKYLPSHESIKQNRFVGMFGGLLHHHNLWHLNRHSVAGGVAVGLFAGLIPGSNPVQFFFAAMFAIVFKVNLPMAALITLYSNPLTIVPIYLVAYAIGEFVIGNGITKIPQVEFSILDKNIDIWIPSMVDWMASLGRTLLTGISILAILLSIIGYFTVHIVWRLYVLHAWRKRAQRHHLDD